MWTPAEPSPQEKFVKLGRLGRPHGVSGLLRLYPFSDGETLRLAKELWVAGQRLAVEHIRAAHDCFLIKFGGIDSPEAARALTHRHVGVPRAALPPLKPGEFYWIDLIGMRCVSATRDFGLVHEVFEAGAQPILRVRADSGSEELIPFVDAIILEVDVARRQIRVDWAGVD
ncbi:MAG: ribosome maturation factor RimM [Casimicrobiaceae bacterium]|nr:ribosome maturation factor RimM [Casimicrobiaceae bacterium]